MPLHKRPPHDDASLFGCVLPPSAFVSTIGKLFSTKHAVERSSFLVKLPFLHTVAVKGGLSSSNIPPSPDDINTDNWDIVYLSVDSHDEDWASPDWVLTLLETSAVLLTLQCCKIGTESPLWHCIIYLLLWLADLLIRWKCDVRSCMCRLANCRYLGRSYDFQEHSLAY